MRSKKAANNYCKLPTAGQTILHIERLVTVRSSRRPATLNVGFPDRLAGRPMANLGRIPSLDWAAGQVPFGRSEWRG